MAEHWRIKQLNDWEKSREREIRVDVEAHWLRSLPGLIGCGIAWFSVEFFHAPYAPLLNRLIAFGAGIYITGRIIVWLRLWGAFIERRLIDIESRLTNENPEYYGGELICTYDTNPIFERLALLEVIEDKLRDLQKAGRLQESHAASIEQRLRSVEALVRQIEMFGTGPQHEEPDLYGRFAP